MRVSNEDVCVSTSCVKTRLLLHRRFAGGSSSGCDASWFQQVSGGRSRNRHRQEHVPSADQLVSSGFLLQRFSARCWFFTLGGQNGTFPRPFSFLSDIRVVKSPEEVLALGRQNLEADWTNFTSLPLIFLFFFFFFELPGCPVSYSSRLPVAATGAVNYLHTTAPWLAVMRRSV